MNLITTILIIVAIITAIIFISTAGFLLLTRKGKNIVQEYCNNKKYVVCHVKGESTGYIEDWKVVPKPDYLTPVGPYDYDLHPRYAALSWKKRLHYNLNEGDVIPDYSSRKDTPGEILIQVQEVKTALHNKAYDFLYKKNNNIALIVAFAGWIVTIIVLIYLAYKLTAMTGTLDIIYQKSITETITPK
jgi:hypothetical protein